MRKFLVPIFIALLLASVFVFAQVPQGPEFIFNNSVNATPIPAASIITAGGTFTTLVLNATSQNLKWKAYVGNVTGKLTLQDSSGYNIYDWVLSSVEGEVYVSRNNSINWSAIRCADNSSIATEESALSITHGKIDSINVTFNRSIHAQFYVGLVQINQSTCPAINTFVNGSRQTASVSSQFQEVLLRDDKTRIVYATPLNSSTYGYATGSRFDFQLIVPDFGSEQISSQVPYYFYVELS